MSRQPDRADGLAAIGTLAMTMGSSTLSAAVGSIKVDFPGYDNRLYILGKSLARRSYTS